MHDFMKDWTIATKLRLLAWLTTLALLGLSAFLSYQQYERSFHERQELTRSTVDIAQGVLTWAHGREKAGELSREQAQAVAMQAIKSLRYRGSEYFWINDMAGLMVMHPTKPALDHTNVLGMKDPNGKALFAEFVATVKSQKAGFVDYYWPKPGSDQPVAKISYVAGFEPWGWVVGSGMYLDDLRAELVVSIQKAAGVVLIALALVWCLERTISRSITGGVRKAVKVATAVAQGDLTQHIEARGQDEVGQLLAAMQHMTQGLQVMVGTVRDAAHGMEVAAEQIAAGNTDLSVRTEQAASNLQQTASSMSEIASTVDDNVKVAHEATQLATSASGVAGKSGEIVAEVVSTMGEINDSSRRIHDIIGVIDGIAFQTNILALNAAVEAARAGEQGRGFAVVATEVRALAGRSSQAAKEIRELIAKSTEKVDAGAELVKNAGLSMQELVVAVERVTTLTQSVRDRADRQSTGIHEVSGAMAGLDAMTSQNAALVEQSAAAAASLREQASRLIGSVRNFKVGHQTSHA